MPRRNHPKPKRRRIAAEPTRSLQYVAHQLVAEGKVSPAALGKMPVAPQRRAGAAGER